MKAALFTGLMVCAATQAHALSCWRPDVARSFQLAAQADEAYVILLGTYEFGDVPSSTTGDINQRRDVEVTAQFSGMFLGENGFQDAPTLDVELAFTCAAAWCGSLQNDGAQVLAFVEQMSDGYRLEIGPCGGQAFTNPTDAQIAQVQACMTGDTCEVAPLR